MALTPDEEARLAKAEAAVASLESTLNLVLANGLQSMLGGPHLRFGEESGAFVSSKGIQFKTRDGFNSPYIAFGPTLYKESMSSARPLITLNSIYWSDFTEIAGGLTADYNDTYKGVVEVYSKQSTLGTATIAASRDDGATYGEIFAEADSSYTNHYMATIKNALLRLESKTVSIVSGAITATASRVEAQTEGAASTDDLTTITNTPKGGEILVIQARHVGRTVVVKNGAGNIYTRGGDCVLDDPSKAIVLLGVNSIWIEIARTFGGGSMKTSSGGYYLIPTGPSGGTAVASSASADTYGSWVEMRAANGNALYIVGLMVRPASNLTYVQVDIGSGPAGAEGSIGEWRFPGSGSPLVVSLPFAIPVAANTRIACRTADSQSTALSNSITLIVVDQADLVSM